MEFKFEPKVRVNVPVIVSNIIKSDVSSFEINQNKLCNMIFAYFAMNYHLIDSSDIVSINNQTLQFTLTQENHDRFSALCDTVSITNKAQFFRVILFNYCNYPRYLRERIIFSSSLKIIEDGIKARRKIKIRYKNEYRIIEPFFIIKSDGETRNYIFTYCEKRQSYCNYRLSNIHAVGVSVNALLEHYDSEYIKQIKNSFDAFLSFGHRVKVRFDDEGEEMYRQNLTHRPKLLAQQDNVFEFECSALKAQLYFPQFMHHAEILEPKDLRTWFKEKFNKVAKLYNQNN